MLGDFKIRFDLREDEELCYKCGVPIKKTAVFCYNCGVSLDKNTGFTALLSRIYWFFKK
jgi:predicted amidophosphoribosyltransferase